MRMSRFYPRTLHQAPAEAVEVGHRLLLRAGLIRPLGAGVFAWLPLGQRVRQRVQALAREALAALGGQEASLPPLVPVDSWGEAGLRQQPVGFNVRDRAGRPLLLPDTLSPLLTTLLRPDLRSHRLLPLLLYHFRPRFRDEGPASPSPLATRQALILEAFSLQPDLASLDQSVQELRQACEGILARCGLATLAAETVVGPDTFPGRAFVDSRVPGDSPFVRCSSCGYVADLQVARVAKDALPSERPLPLKEIPTPGCHSIADLAAFLSIPESRTAKAVFLVSDERFFFVVVRGDMEVNEQKLARLVGARDLRPAQDHEIAALGASPGYASPIGIRRGAPEVGLGQVRIVVDELIPDCPNLVAGANKEDAHLLNVNYGRDYTADLVADLVTARPGDPCPHCRTPLERFRSTVLGRTWAPAGRFSEALGATYQDAGGEERPLLLACAEVELDRLVSACVQVHHDEDGIYWPAALAPYAVYLLSIGNAPEVTEAAAALYQDLRAAGIAVLFDDRDERAGFKFTDSDLFGLPLRVAVSRRTLQQQRAEVKRRDQPREAVAEVPLDEVVAWIRQQLSDLSDEGGVDA